MGRAYTNLSRFFIGVREARMSIENYAIKEEGYITEFLPQVRY